MNTEELITALRQLNIISHTPTTGRAGVPIAYYADFKKVCERPTVLAHVAHLLAQLIDSNTTALAASGYGGTPLATLVAVEKNLPLTLVRDQVRPHGTKKLFEGYQPKGGDRVIIVDDVFNTGSNMREIMQKVEKAGATVIQAVVVIKRGEGSVDLPVEHLVDVEALL